MTWSNSTAYSSDSRGADAPGRITRCRGFTLIELIVTAIVAAILTTLVIPSMMTFVFNNRLTTQINSFAADLAFARSEAIKRGAVVSVTALDGSDNQNEWGPGWHTVAPDGSDLRSTPALSGDNRLDSIEDRTTIQYLASGFIADTSSLHFKLCDHRSGPFGKELTLELSGRTATRGQVNCP